jgi:hypothetical protein
MYNHFLNRTGKKYSIILPLLARPIRKLFKRFWMLASGIPAKGFGYCNGLTRFCHPQKTIYWMIGIIVGSAVL